MPGCSSGESPREPGSITIAARIIAHGGLVVYPTETLYGLGADAFNPQALQRLVDVKGREPGKPVAVLVDGLEMAMLLASDVPPAARALMSQFWPGPLTIVLPARPSVASILTGAGTHIGMRVSSHPLATALVRAVGHPLTAPSANPAGKRAPARIEEARAYFGDRIDYYLDGGPLAGEPASTVVRVDDGLAIVREGAIAADRLRASLRGMVNPW